jgi:hypothetical protein
MLSTRYPTLAPRVHDVLGLPRGVAQVATVGMLA